MEKGANETELLAVSLRSPSFCGRESGEIRRRDSWSRAHPIISSLSLSSESQASRMTDPRRRTREIPRRWIRGI